MATSTVSGKTAEIVAVAGDMVVTDVVADGVRSARCADPNVPTSISTHGPNCTLGAAK
jgi:hypothetical protein